MPKSTHVLLLLNIQACFFGGARSAPPSAAARFAGAGNGAARGAARS